MSNVDRLQSLHILQALEVVYGHGVMVGHVFNFPSVGREIPSHTCSVVYLFSHSHMDDRHLDLCTKIYPID